MRGLLLIDKPAGWTSHDVVAKVRGLAKTRRVGHAGTLDPQATGLLVAAVGDATRWLDWLPSDKAYRAGILFGRETNTQDIWGETVAETDASALDDGTIRPVLEQMAAVTSQVPPMVSAVKQGGRKLYEMAREGKQVERQARPVKVWGVRVLSVTPPEAEFELQCSAGTYVRTLCHEAGKALGLGACMNSLRRIRSGAFELSQAHTMEALEQAATQGRLEPLLVDANQALAHVPVRELNDDEALGVEQGRPVKNTGAGERWRLCRPDGSLAALGLSSNGVIKPDKVFKREAT